MNLRRHLILIPAMVFTLGFCLVPLQVAADDISAHHAMGRMQEGEVLSLLN